MRLANVDFPTSLLDALRDNKLVVFAGAGVSMGEPAGLPNFKGLTNKIAEHCPETRRKNESLEHFLGRLHDAGVPVHHLAKENLSRDDLKPTPLHQELLRLYRRDAPVRLVTTNFDLLFEQAAEEIFDNTPQVFCAPALPLGHKFNGIIHIHGSVNQHDDMVLTDRDFGRAYLSDGQARRFFLGLHNNFTVLFVGYSHSDTVMNYLARALPPQTTEYQRYALVPKTIDTDYQHWIELGVETILYPQHGNDHSELDQAICLLADYMRRGMVGWQREISAIADKRPSELTEEDEGIINHALDDDTKTPFFTRNASHSDWIEWLDVREHLDRLFNDGQLKESDKILSWWLADKYLEDYSDLIFLLIANHRTSLHPTFWEHIARKIGGGNDTSLDTPVLSRWIALLLSTAPEKGHTSDDGYVNTSHWLTEIAQRCIPHQMIKELLSIFDTMIRSLLSIEENHYRPRHETEIDLRISLDVPLVGEYDELKEVWEKGLKPHLSKIAQPLLEKVIRSLESQYSFYCTWGRADRLLEPVSTRRSAIADHSQNVGGDENDVLIDAARDSLDWLAAHETDVAAYWCNRLVESDSPLQRRLAVHSLSTRKDLTPDEKIKWLLGHIDLHEYSIHHEVYQAMRHAYPEAGVDCRANVIEAVLSYRFPHEEHPDKEEITAREHFYWFDWLHKAKEDCPLALKARNEVLMEYPHFMPKKHADFTSYIQPGGIDIPSHLTCEDLLANPTPDKIIQFSSMEAPVVRGEIERLKRAIKEDFDKGLNFTNALVEAELWDSNLWRDLIYTWAKMELDINKHRQVLKYFSRTELYSKCSYEITDGLYALVKNGGPSYAVELLPQALQIAAAVWESLERDISVDLKHGWYNQSASYPVWGLANFWLSAASLWRKQQDPPPATLSEDYRRPLMEIIKDSSQMGGLGKSILTSQLTFLLAVDEEWTQKHLLPLFELDNADFQAAWDGFVTTGRLSPPVGEALKNLFLKAVTRISADLCPQRHGFVECYTVMLIYVVNVVDDVLDTWIPKLFEYGRQQSEPVNREPTLLRDDNRTIPEIFTLKVGRCLKNMSDSDKEELWQNWLKKYWQNRLYGKPTPLTSDEAGLMLDWLPELNTQFSEAVDLTIKYKQGPALKNTRIFACLITYKTWEKYPEAVAKLLIYLWKWNVPYWYRDSVSKIIESLLESDIFSELKQQLEDIRIQLP